MVKKQYRLSDKNTTAMTDEIKVAYYKQYPILAQEGETNPHNIDDILSWLIKFWRDNW